MSPFEPISASVVLYNTKRHLLQRVYQSINQSNLKINLYLIDNSASPCIDPGDYPGAYYDFVGRNVGYGAGHNRALTKVIDSSKYHFILNPDIFFDVPTLPAILQFMDNDPTIGQVMPRIIYPNGELQYLCKLIPSPMDLILRRFLPSQLNTRFQYRMDRFEMRDSGYQTIMDAPFLSGCFMALRIASLRNIGLFDERFFMYAEDIDLSRRMAESYRTTYFPQVCVIHDHARESYSSPRMLLIHVANIIKYFNKWGWVFDEKRKRINQATLDGLSRLPSPKVY